MSIKLVLTLLAFSGLAGIALGYVLRLLIALGQRGSLELEVKQKLLEAREKAAQIEKEAEERADRIEAERLSPLEEREERLEKTADRLAKREEFLDDRDRALAEESERVKARENETANLKRDAENVLKERRAELVRIGHFSEKEARERLIKEIEAVEEEATLTRIQKLEAHGRERPEEKARTTLMPPIHRRENRGMPK